MSSRVFDDKYNAGDVMYATQVVWLRIVPQREAANKQSITVCHSPTFITAAPLFALIKEKCTVSAGNITARNTQTYVL